MQELEKFTLDQLRLLQTQWKIKQRESSRTLAYITKEIKRRVKHGNKT